MMTKAERTELRSLLKQRFKVLRNDVTQRMHELYAELDARIAERFADDDKAWADIAFTIDEAAREANRKANDVVHGHVGRAGWPNELSLVRTVDVLTIKQHIANRRPEQERGWVRRQGRDRIDATVRDAFLQLDRQETDLLERLITGALESDEARGFLAEIPTVSALVPSARLLELEQSLREDGMP